MAGHSAAWRWSLALFLLLCLAVIWIFRHLPLTDLPEYLHAADTLAETLSGDAPRHAAFFQIDVPIQPFGSTYFWFAAVSSFLLDVETATRLYLSIALVGTILALASWLKTVEPGREVQALPAGMLVYGFFFQVGFLPYLFAMPFFFLALRAGAMIGSPARGRRIALVVWLSTLLLVVYFSHILAFGLLVLLLFAQAWLSGGRRLALLALTAVPAFLHLAWFLVTETPLAPALIFQWNYTLLLFHFTSLALPFNLLFDPPSGQWKYQTETLAAWVLVASAFLVAGLRGGRVSRRMGILSLLLFSIWLVTPTNLASSAGTLWISLHVTYPLAFLLVAAGPTGWSRRTIPLVLVVLGCLLTAGGEIWRMVGFQGEGRDLQAVIDSVPEGQRIQPVITDPESRWFPNRPFFHAGSWYNFQKGGTTPYSFAHISHFPLRYRQPWSTKVPGEWYMSRFNYRDHGRGTDYFLVRSSDKTILKELSENVPLHARAGSWLVFGPNPAP